MLSYDPTMRPPLLIISDSELLLFIFIKKKLEGKGQESTQAVY